jgi:hypothetical protein
MEGHNSQTIGKTGIQRCTKCGHVHLHNEISRLVTSLGCDYEESQKYRNWIKRNWPSMAKSKGY